VTDCWGMMDSSQFAGGQLDVQFDEILVNLKPYVIKIQQQPGLSLHFLYSKVC